MTEKNPTSQDMATAPKPGGKTNSEKTFKQRMLKWLVIVLAASAVCFFAYRWIGSTTYRGTVQRVYEKQAEYRVEFTEIDGTVHVVGNREIRFPYFKVDTADLHAELNGLSKSGDVIDLKVWGLRVAWFSMFPNIIGAEFVSSDSQRSRARAELIAQEVLSTLQKKGMLKGGEGIRDDLILAIEKGMKAPETIEKKKEIQ